MKNKSPYPIPRFVLTGCAIMTGITLGTFAAGIITAAAPTATQEPQVAHESSLHLTVEEAAPTRAALALEPEKVVVMKCPTLPAPAETSEEPSEPAAEEAPAEEWKSLGTFNLTAYCSCESCCGYWATIRPKDENGNPIVYTSTGTVAEQGRTIAVDPTVIPYGSKVKIGETVYIAEDCGGAIKGNRIDVYHADHQAALVFGRWDSEVYIEIE